MKELAEMLMNLIDVKLDISIGSLPVRLLETSVRLINLFKIPISGGRVPNRRRLDIVKAVTRRFSSHVTPENEQCEFSIFQSGNKSDEFGATIEALSFINASKSEIAFENFK